MLSRPFETYCSAVCSLVRWKGYRENISAELTAHLEDHAELLAAQGLPMEEAQSQAVAAMGDPYALGKELDALHSPWWPRLSRVFTVLALFIILATTLFGLTRDATLFDRRFAPFADPAKLLLQTEDVYGGDHQPVLVASGRAKGGGKLGPYAFSATGAAGLFRRGSGGEVSYSIDVIFSSATPWFWLDWFSGNPQPKFLRVGDGPLLEAEAVFWDLPEQGVFRRWYRYSTFLDGPVSGPCTIEVGENHDMIYTFTLEEVSAP